MGGGGGGGGRGERTVIIFPIQTTFDIKVCVFSTFVSDCAIFFSPFPLQLVGCRCSLVTQEFLCCLHSFLPILWCFRNCIEGGSHA